MSVSLPRHDQPAHDDGNWISFHDLVSGPDLENEPEFRIDPDLGQPYDPSRPWKFYMPGTRVGSGRWFARQNLWVALCNYENHHDFQPMACRLMGYLLGWGARNYTDVMTLTTRQMAHDVGVDRRTIRRSLDWLIAEKWLAVVERGRSGKTSTRSAVYKILSGPGVSSKTKCAHKGSFRTPPPRSREPEYLGSPSTPAPVEQGTKEPLAPRVSTQGLAPSPYGLLVSGRSETMESETSVNRTRTPARDWLAGVLAHGPVPAAEVVRLGGEQGYSRATVYRAAKALGVDTSREVAVSGQGDGRPPVRIAVWFLL